MGKKWEKDVEEGRGEEHGESIWGKKSWKKSMKKTWRERDFEVPLDILQCMDCRIATIIG